MDNTAFGIAKNFKRTSSKRIDEVRKRLAFRRMQNDIWKWKLSTERILQRKCTF